MTEIITCIAIKPIELTVYSFMATPRNFQLTIETISDVIECW